MKKLLFIFTAITLSYATHAMDKKPIPPKTTTIPSSKKQSLSSNDIALIFYGLITEKTEKKALYLYQHPAKL